jgi:hypothetical protein
MKTIVALITFFAFLVSVPIAMANNGANQRAEIDRIWQKEQAYQKHLDNKFDTIQRAANKDLARMSVGSHANTVDSVQ